MMSKKLRSIAGPRVLFFINGLDRLDLQPGFAAPFVLLRGRMDITLVSFRYLPLPSVTFPSPNPLRASLVSSMEWWIRLAVW